MGVLFEEQDLERYYLNIDFGDTAKSQQVADGIAAAGKGIRNLGAVANRLEQPLRFALFGIGIGMGLWGVAQLVKAIRRPKHEREGH